MVAKEHGYAALVLNTNEDEKLEREAIVTSLSRNFFANLINLFIENNLQ